MDGFRDRMGRGSSDRYDRFDESRFVDRGARRTSSFGSQQQPPMPSGVSADEISKIVDDSNANQLNIINDFNEDTKDFIYSANQKIQTSIDDLQKAIDSVAGTVEKIDAKEIVIPEPVAPVQVDNECQDEILRIARDNRDLLSQFAEEQVSMLIRGNSSMLSHISESLEEKGDILRDILNTANQQAQQAQQPQINPVMPLPDTGANEEVLQTVINNNTLLNALRSEIAGMQADIRESASERRPIDDNGPLDATPVTKEEMDLLYRDMEEHVHKECVKVYKNVQAALEAQNASVGESVKAGTGGLKFLVIFNLILTVLNVIVAVFFGLGLFS